MAMFELQTPDGQTFEVEAPDEASALEALGQMQGGPQEQVGVGEDMARGAAAGLGRGTVSLPGMFGDAAQTNSNLLKGGAKMLGAPEWAQDAAGVAGKAMTGPLGMFAPTSEQLTGAAAAVTRPDQGESFLEYDAKTIPGQIAQKGATLVPSFALGPGAVIPKAAGWAGATLGSEGVKQLSDNPDVKPYLELGGTLAGGAAGLTAAEQLLARSAKAKALKGIPTTKQIKMTSKRDFQQADAIGLALKPQGYSEMIDDVYRAAGDDGFFAANHPKLANAFTEAEKYRGSPMTLDQLKGIRTKIKSAYDPANPDQNRVMDAALTKFDDFIENKLLPENVLSGDPKAASLILKSARANWSKFRKSELFDNIKQNAKNAVGANYTEAGFQTAVRQQLRAIAKDDFKRYKYLNEHERRMILDVIAGGGVENFMRRLGKFSLLSSTGPIKTGGAALVASMFGPQVGATVAGALGVGGTIARPIGTSMGKTAFDNLNATIRKGSPLGLRKIPSNIPVQGLIQFNRAGQPVNDQGR